MYQTPIGARLGNIMSGLRVTAGALLVLSGLLLVGTSPVQRLDKPRLCVPVPECTETGKLPIPCEGFCAKFFLCLAPGQRALVDTCPFSLFGLGTWFNPEEKQCNLHFNKDCDWYKRLPTSTELPPSTTSQASEPPSDEPTAETTEPSKGSPVPDSHNRSGGRSAGDSTDDPNPSSDASATEEPTSSPPSDTEQPSDDTEVPTEATEEPTEATEEPTEATEAPTEATEEPTEATEETTEATEAPTEATEEPTEATEEPTEATEEPTEAAEEPTEATEEPTEASEAPTEATEEPTEATEAPTEATEEPTEATEAPTEATEEPTEATEEPTEATEAPTEATEEPTEATEAPTEATEEPTEATEAPTEATEDLTDVTEATNEPTGPSKATDEVGDVTEESTTTTDSTWPPVPAPSICTNDIESILLPDSTDCSRYIFCSRGRVWNMPCGAGTWFSYKKQTCDHQWAVDCNNVDPRSASETTDDEIPKTTPVYDSEITDETVPAETTETDPVKTTEADSTDAPATDSPGTTQADESEATEAESAETTEAQPAETTEAEPAKTTDTAEASTEVPSWPPVPAPTDCSADQSDIMLPDPSSCSRYIRCYLGRTWDMPCPTGTLFSYEKQKCDNAWAVQCGNVKLAPSTVEDNTTPAPWPPVPAPTICSADQSDIMLPDPTSCNRYIRCYLGRTWDMPCPPGTRFSYGRQKCDNAWAVPCEN